MTVLLKMYTLAILLLSGLATLGHILCSGCPILFGGSSSSSSSKDLSVIAPQSDTIFTAKILEFLDSFSLKDKNDQLRGGSGIPVLVQVKTVYKGDPKLASHLLVVRGATAEPCHRRGKKMSKRRLLLGIGKDFKPGDTRLFLTNGQSPGVYGLAAPVLPVNLKNLRQMWAIGRREKKRQKIQVLMKIKERHKGKSCLITMPEILGRSFKINIGTTYISVVITAVIFGWTSFKVEGLPPRLNKTKNTIFLRRTSLPCALQTVVFCSRH